MKKKSEQLASGLVILATMIGGIIRIQAVLTSLVPLNDGGLFYTMTNDLINNGFSLPINTTYNLASIPFAYPPLAFYLTGLIHVIFGFSVLDIVRILPAIISTLTIPAFYLLGRELSETRETAGFATLAFALLPRAFDWTIMGGGLTRSFGLLFAILTLWQAKHYFSSPSLKTLLGFTLSSILTLISHPEATVHTAIGTILIYWYFNHSKKSFFSLFACAALILTATIPWWGLVLSRHSLAPFEAVRTAAGQDSYNPLVGLITFFRFYFSDEPFMSLFAVMGVIGLFGFFAVKKSFIPVWIFGTHFLEPRGGTLYMMLPLAIACGYALDQMLLPAIRMKTSNEGISTFKTNQTAYVFLAFVLLYGTFSAYFITSKISSTSLTSEDLDAFRWIANNIPTQSRFAILSNAEPLRDSLSEWFPALNDKISVATVFGYEWVNDSNFSQRVKNYKYLQTCYNQEAACVDSWSEKTGIKFDYIYIHTVAVPTPMATLSLKKSPHYRLLYEASGIAIFENNKE